MKSKPKQIDTSHSQILDYNPKWVEIFEQEARRVKELLGDKITKIEHIGSTSILGAMSKPIIDFAIEIPSWKDAAALIEPLATLGYEFDIVNHEKFEKPERYMFRKGTPTKFHLSVAYRDRGSFLERQILFRDYLRQHNEDRDAYSALKQGLIKKDPTGRNEYISDKTDFIMRILKKAGFQNKWFDLSKY